MALPDIFQPLGGEPKGMALDRIYNDPATGYVLDLSERFAKRELSESSFKDFLNSLPSDAAAERAKLEQLLAGNAVEADLSSRSGQLVWAAGLAYAFQNNPPGSIRSHAIWRTLTRNPQVSGSLGAAARYVDLSLTNRSATMDWGTPGSWFWFAPDKNHINIDLFHTLLTGFGKDPAPGVKGMAHAAGVMMHEVGHSQLTTRFTKRMAELQKREQEFMEASKERKLTRDEFKELTRVRKEFQLRMNVFNAAEDNCVNQYAANYGQDFPHDFGASLNVCNILLQGSGAYMRAAQAGKLPPGADAVADPQQREIEKAKEALGKLNQAIALSFYTTNGLFNRNDIETWKRLGVNPDDIDAIDTSALNTAADHFLTTSQNDFERLLDLNVGVGGMSQQQPVSRDRWLLRSVFARSVDSYADRRCQIVDEIWDKYAAPHAKILIDAAEENAENKMNQKQDGQQNEGQGQGQNQSGNQQSSGGGSSQSQGGDDPSPSQGGEEGGGGSGSVDVEGVGKMDIDGNPLPSTPEAARKQGRKGAEDQNKPEDAQSVRDLAKGAKQDDAKEKGRKNEPANNNGNDDKGGKSSGTASDALDGLNGSSGEYSRRQDVDLAALAQGSWTEFRKRINELEPVINRVVEDMKFVREQQKQPVRQMSKRREELPRSGGDIMRQLDQRRHLSGAIARATGQIPNQIERKKWRVEDVEKEPTTVELWILGDGSGSTRQSLSHGVRRIDSCLQTMAILHEGGKRADLDVYAGIWENHHVRMLSEPTFTEEQIGRNFDSVRLSGGVGTIYNTPIPQIIDRLSKQRTNAQGQLNRFGGMTHFLIVLDGTKNDLEIQETANMLLTLFRVGPAVSVDIAYLGGHQDCEAQEIVRRVKDKNPSAAIDILEANDARDAPMLLVKKIKQRMERASHQAVPDSQKRDAFGEAHRAMMRANLG